MLLILVAALSSVTCQNSPLECNFTVEWNGYTCVLNGVVVLDPNQNVTISGSHVDNRTNANVDVVRITNSNTPFMIPQIFTIFTNVSILNIFDSHVQSLSLPAISNLREIYMQGNNITRIENATFINQTHLTYLNLRNNSIHEIAEDAFLGLGILDSLVLIANRIENIAPRTFQPLTTVRYLDLERNNLTRISEEIFSSNTRIAYLYLEYNQISEISPFFIQNFSEVLSYINLSGNRCVNRSFSVERDDEFFKILLHNSLRTCFTNYVGDVPDVRRITLEFRGSLKLFDEFGNLIANVPE